MTFRRVSVMPNGTPIDFVQAQHKDYLRALGEVQSGSTQIADFRRIREFDPDIRRVFVWEPSYYLTDWNRRQYDHDSQSLLERTTAMVREMYTNGINWWCIDGVDAQVKAVDMAGLRYVGHCDPTCARNRDGQTFLEWQGQDLLVWSKLPAVMLNISAIQWDSSMNSTLGRYKRWIGEDRIPHIRKHFSDAFEGPLEHLRMKARGNGAGRRSPWLPEAFSRFSYEDVFAGSDNRSLARWAAENGKSETESLWKHSAYGEQTGWHTAREGECMRFRPLDYWGRETMIPWLNKVIWFFLLRATNTDSGPYLEFCYHQGEGGSFEHRFDLRTQAPRLWKLLTEAEVHELVETPWFVYRWLTMPYDWRKPFEARKFGVGFDKLTGQPIRIARRG